MKKSELKNIIKECVKEVIFEEGILSGIITEVAQGLSATATPSLRQPSPLPQNENRSEEHTSELQSPKESISEPSTF